MLSHFYCALSVPDFISDINIGDIVIRFHHIVFYHKTEELIDVKNTLQNFSARDKRGIRPLIRMSSGIVTMKLFFINIIGYAARNETAAVFRP
jgi:hypothetical protein